MTAGGEARAPSSGERGWRAAAKRWYRRLRDRRTRRRLLAGARGGSIVVASTWQYPQPTHTFVNQEMLGLSRLGHALWVFAGECTSAAGLARRFAPLLPRVAVVETLAELGRADLQALDRTHAARVETFLAHVARETGRSVADLRREELVLRAATFTRLTSLAGARCLQSWFCYEMSFLAMFAAQVLGIPRVLSCHVDHVLDDAPFKCVKLHLATADLVLAISEQARDELVAIGGPGCRDRIVLKRIGVDGAAFRPLRTAPRDADPLSIVSVCRLEPKKGLEVLVDAAAILKRRARAVRVQLVGGPDEGHAASRDYAARLRALVQSRGLGDVVDMPGPVANDALPGLLARANVFAAPYVQLATGDKDGVPTCVLEAMAAGVPVVASRVGALGEVIADGENGILVPQRDPEALAAALERLHDDGALRQRLAAAAASRFDREFDSAVVDRELHARMRAWLAP